MLGAECRRRIRNAAKSKVGQFSFPRVPGHGHGGTVPKIASLCRSLTGNCACHRHAPAGGAGRSGGGRVQLRGMQHRSHHRPCPEVPAGACTGDVTGSLQSRANWPGVPGCCWASTCRLEPGRGNAGGAPARRRPARRRVPAAPRRGRPQAAHGAARQARRGAKGSPLAPAGGLGRSPIWSSRTARRPRTPRQRTPAPTARSPACPRPGPAGRRCCGASSPRCAGTA